MKEKEIQTDFQNSVIETDDVDIPENKISPQYYLHLGILNVQNAYANVDIKTGILRFILSVDQLENILLAKGASDKFKQSITQITDKIITDTSITGNVIEGVSQKQLALQQHKFKYIMEEIFSGSKKVGPLKH